MTGTTFSRLCRLLKHLFLQPQYTGRYLTNSIFRKSAMDLQVPWISYAAIDFLKLFVTNRMRVFEYGSGGSTLFFAHLANTVVSVEDSSAWLERVRHRVDSSSLSNVDLRYVPYDFHLADKFESSPYLNSIPNREFDVILVDGTEEIIQVRPQCFYHAENFVKPGGIIIVDDSWRYEGLRSANRAKSFRVFKSVGPARPGVTTTDIFFY